MFDSYAMTLISYRHTMISHKDSTNKDCFVVLLINDVTNNIISQTCEWHSAVDWIVERVWQGQLPQRMQVVSCHVHVIINCEVIKTLNSHIKHAQSSNFTFST